jgi:4-aminobutyrate aminotransferase/(S)-3-amino-2-methylpropionate transaminase
MNTKSVSLDEELLKIESQYCSWGDTVHYSEHLNIFTNSDGIYLFDRQGIPYLDLQMGYSSSNFGYKNKRLHDALKKQIDTLPQLAGQYLHEEKIRLAEKIAVDIEKKFGVKGRVHFNVGGAQAIEDAIKVVRNHTGKNQMFAFMGGYHGRTLGATSITSSFRYRENYGHFSDRATFIPFPYQFRCPSDRKEACCDLTCLKPFQKMFESEYYSVHNPKNNNCEFGAFFAEPVQGTGGFIIPPKNYLKELKKTLDKHNVLFVDDEIKMGFFRTGKLWAIEHFDVVPDIITFGKSLTNGLNPLSGIWAKNDLINPKVWGPGMTHSTFSSNPLGTAAGLAVMNLIEDSDFQTSVPQKGAYFLKKLEQIKAKYYPYVGNVAGIGLALRVEMCQKDGFTPNRALTNEVMNIGLEGKLKHDGKNYGLVLDIGGYYKNVFTLAPSLFITEEEIDLSLKLFDQALTQALSQHKA